MRILGLLVLLLTFWSLDAQVHYSYDNLNRLDSVIQNNGEFVKYSYDKVGNRTQEDYGIKLPTGNFQFIVTPVECRKSELGKIEFKSKAEIPWRMTLLGPGGYQLDTFFTYHNLLSDTGLVIENLEPGGYLMEYTYHLYTKRAVTFRRNNVYVAEKPSSLQFDTIEVDQKYKFTLTNGHPRFQVYVNGVLSETLDSINSTFVANAGQTVKIVDACGSEKEVKLPGTSSILGLASDGGLLIYPNPISSELVIEFKEPSNGYESIEISTLTGTLVYQNKIQDGASKLKINTSQLSSGTYLVKLIGNKEVFLKVMKQ